MLGSEQLSVLEGAIRYAAGHGIRLCVSTTRFVFISLLYNVIVPSREREERKKKKKNAPAGPNWTDVYRSTARVFIKQKQKNQKTMRLLGSERLINRPAINRRNRAEYI